MTQTIPQAPYLGPHHNEHEEFQVMGEQLAAKVEQLLHEGNVRRIIVKHDGYSVLEIPLTIGVVGAIIAPALAAVGAIGAMVTNCTVEVVRSAPLEASSMPTPPQPGTTIPPMTLASHQVYSLATDGMQLFREGPIRTLMGTTTIDLMSAPLEPGTYTLEVMVTMGSVEIFLPHYVQYTLDGNTMFGGRTHHDGPRAWGMLKQRLYHIVDLPGQPPDFATAQPNPERPVLIRFVTHITMGSVDFYQL